MFDDQPIGQGQVPGNLPIGEPEDMFAGTDTVPDSPQPPANVPPAASAPPVQPAAQTAPPAASPTALTAGVLKPKVAAEAEEQAAPPADMFAETEHDVQPPSQPGAEAPMESANLNESAPIVETTEPTPAPSFPAAPEQPMAPPVSMQPQASPPADDISVPPALPQDDMYNIKEPSLSRGIMTVIIIIVVFAILGGGGWWIYSSFIASAPGTDNSFETNFERDVAPVAFPPAAEETDSTVAVPGVPNIQQQDQEDVAVPNTNIDDTVLFGEPIDSDSDGLDDAREASIGTDPQNWDTDGDELSDGDEVIIWKTNPQNADSDGDTYLDGQEVKAGYNPAGPGRIFEPPGTPAIEATSTPTTSPAST